MSVLVTYGSKRGGTIGLAEIVATDLREEGLQVDLVPPNQVKRLDEYEAVVVGGALYASRWHRAAKRFVKRHTSELRKRAVFFFSSGPLDDSATKNDIPPVKGVQALMERVGVRGDTSPLAVAYRPIPKASQPVPWRRTRPETGATALRSGPGPGPSPPSFARCTPSDRWLSSATVRSHWSRRVSRVRGTSALSSPRNLKVRQVLGEGVRNQLHLRVVDWMLRWLAIVVVLVATLAAGVAGGGTSSVAATDTARLWGRLHRAPRSRRFGTSW